MVWNLCQEKMWLQPEHFRHCCWQHGWPWSFWVRIGHRWWGAIPIRTLLLKHFIRHLNFWNTMYSWLQQIQYKGCWFVGSLQEDEEETKKAGPEGKRQKKVVWEWGGCTTTWFRVLSRLESQNVNLSHTLALLFYHLGTIVMRTVQKMRMERQKSMPGRRKVSATHGSKRPHQWWAHPVRKRLSNALTRNED